MESGRIATLSRNEILEKGDLHVANLVGVTNPVPNYDASNNNRTLPAAPKPSDTRIQNIPDPSRVGRPDARTDQQGANDALNSGVLRYDSNLQFFLQQMRDMPELGAELSKLVTLMQGLVTTPGLAAGVTEELSGFLELLKMDPDAFRQFFQTQMEAGNRFAGPLFSLLREVYQKTPGDTVRGAILNFAKRYSDFSATGHIGRSMLSLLRQLSDYLPQSWRGQLAELTGKLENGLQAGARAENLELLQGQILPYLGSYIKRYHDMGTARTLLGMLMLHMARYENGAEEGVMLAFRQLGGYGDTLAGLNQLDDQTLWKLLRENQFTKAAQADTLRSSWPGRRSGRCRENTARTCGRRFRRSCGPCCSMRAYSSRCTIPLSRWSGRAGGCTRSYGWTRTRRSGRRPGMGAGTDIRSSSCSRWISPQWAFWR